MGELGVVIVLVIYGLGVWTLCVFVKKDNSERGKTKRGKHK